ncbi:MAG: GNAT family N-acetyltransferase [Bacteroidales bacterium]|jgi:GNAT superfamily N-acetyltransferase|nr:GNAT family N-acetyltransferase [Bacteroidales bacterium]
MITTCNPQLRSKLRELWKLCFQDSSKFLNMFFEDRFNDNNALLLVDDRDHSRIISSLYIEPYMFSFYHGNLPLAYISYVCTLPEERNRGYMGQLLRSAIRTIYERRYAMAALYPNPNYSELQKYYCKFGFEQVFKIPARKIVPLKQLYEKSKCNIDRAFEEYDRRYNRRDFTIIVPKACFRTVMKDAISDNFAVRGRLGGMMRIIRLQVLMDVFLRYLKTVDNDTKELTVQQLKEPTKLEAKRQDTMFNCKDDILSANSGCFDVSNYICKDTFYRADLPDSVSINELCRFLFGATVHNLPEWFHKNQCSTNAPMMQLMLE